MRAADHYFVEHQKHEVPSALLVWFNGGLVPFEFHKKTIALG